MSWLTQGLTQSVTGRISQLSGQLKDILNEGTEDVFDPNNEIKVLNEKLKENDRHIEMLKMECSRWQDESNELSIKCQTYEAQLEQKYNDYRSNIQQKDALIADLRKQINSLQSSNTSSNNDLMSRSINFNDGSTNYQKSALMEEFEDLMPHSELSDFINLQKEIKRLNEDNIHLSNENKQLLNRLRYFENKKDEEDDSSDFNETSNFKVNEFELRFQMQNELENLKQELYNLKNRHQEEIIAIENNYKERMKRQLNENSLEIENLRKSLSDLEKQLQEKQKEFEIQKLVDESQKFVTAPSDEKISSNKSDDGWCLNGEEIHLDLEDKQEKKQSNENEYKEEIEHLKNQIEMFENELEQANSLIQKLKLQNRENKTPPRPTTTKTSTVESQTEPVSETTDHLDLSSYKQEVSIQTAAYVNEAELKYQQEIEILTKKLKDLDNEKQQNIDLLQIINLKLEDESKSKQVIIDKKNFEIDNLEKEIDSFKLELKQLQQSVNQEKLLQMQEQKQERHELAKLRSENTELKIKLDEKLSEIKLLGDQINDLNVNINSLKSADSSLFEELQLKTQQFLIELDSANQQIAQLKSEIEKSNEQRKQFEFVLDEKTRECSQLKLDLQKNLQHIGAQSKAIEKLQNELKQSELDKQQQQKHLEEENLQQQQKQQQQQQHQYQSKHMQKFEDKELQTDMTERQISDQIEELIFLKQQYNQIYSYLEQKNQESLSYYNEIQRLNQVLSEMSRELQNSRSLNETLNEQYDNLLKEFQLEQRMVDDLNQQTSELTKTLINTTNAAVLQMQDEKRSIGTETNDLLVNNKNDESIIDESQIIEENQMKKEIEEDLAQQEKERIQQIEERNQQIVEQMQFQIQQMQVQIDQLIKEKEYLLNESQNQVNEFNSKLNEQYNYYENELRNRNESLKQIKQNEEQNVQRLSKELERLREHLVEMSDNYTREAIQAEDREKQLRIALNDAQKMFEQQGTSIESSSKELEQKIEQMTQINQELRNEREKLKDRLKQSEESYNHQIKVTKNLELVLDRLQNEKDGQHSIEITKYQQTIKDHASLIHSLQKDAQSYQNQIEELRRSLEDALLLEVDLSNKEDLIGQLQAQIATKDSLIESLDKRVNEIQKVNESFIENYSTARKKQVLKLIGTMLGFSQNDFEQVESSTESKWFGGLLKTSPTGNNKSSQKTSNQQLSISSSDSINKSFTELLIQYVDRESKPKPSLVFDLNDSSLSHTNKKTDSPLIENSLRSPSANNSSMLLNKDTTASAVKFFNNSLISASNNDLTLVNRNQSSVLSSSVQGSLLSSSNQTNTSIIASNIASPAVANSFLEQILK